VHTITLLKAYACKNIHKQLRKGYFMLSPSSTSAFVLYSPSSNPFENECSSNVAKERLESDDNVKVTEAKLLCRSVLNINPEKVSTICELARPRFQKGDDVEAEKLCRGMIETDPRDVQAMNHLARLLFQKGEDVEAEKLCLGMIEINPEDFITITHVGNFLFKKGEYGEAERFYIKALKINPQYVPALVNLDDLRQEMKSIGRTKDTLDGRLSDLKLP
jgi:tetratricopeptide (TPR) repeat protein